MYFIGIDLGWKEKPTTGICVLDENANIKLLKTVRGEDLFTSLQKHLKEAGCVAIDAPLTLGPGKGKLRLFEKFLLTKPFRSWKASPLPPALIYKLSYHAQEVVGKMERRGFKLNQTLIEVFPSLLYTVMKQPAGIKFVDRHQKGAFYAAFVAYLHYKEETFWVGWRDGKLFLPIYYYWKKPFRETFTSVWRKKNKLRYRLLLSNLKV